MAEQYRPDDMSIKPKHVIVGDIIMGHHESDPTMSPFKLYQEGIIGGPKGPYEVTHVLAKASQSDLPGVYYREANGTKKRYVDYDTRETLWLIVRFRPGIPKFIAEYPERCVRCRGKIYVGLNKVIHERGGADTCP